MSDWMTSENIAIGSTVLWGISEALSMIPAIKANGVFQLVFNILSIFAGKRQ